MQSQWYGDVGAYDPSYVTDPLAVAARDYSPYAASSSGWWTPRAPDSVTDPYGMSGCVGVLRCGGVCGCVGVMRCGGVCGCVGVVRCGGVCGCGKLF